MMNGYASVETNSPTNSFDLNKSEDELEKSGTQNEAYGIPGDDSSPVHVQAAEINGNVSTLAEHQEPKAAETRVYLRRWLILGLFVFHSMTNAFQWIQYSIIANVIEDYYDVMSIAVDWTSMIYMVVYIPLIFPASWLLGKKGLRVTVLLGSFGTALGAWIKCASVAPSRFYVTMIGQTVCAISQIFILGIPPRLAAVWFGPKEVSTACSIGVFGNQMGVALGFLLPPVMVPSSNGTDIDAVTRGLNVMFYGVAGFSTVLFVLIVLLFKAEPPCPPSAAAATSAADSDKDQFVKSILRLIKNRNYMLLLISYGINVGVFYAISTLLNQVFLSHFEGEELNAGRIGLTIVVSGMAGSVVCGIVLDRTHKFKETTLAVYIFSFLGMVAYTFNFEADLIWVVFLVAGFLGFFMTGYLPVGFEFAAEITYPESEGTSSGLLNASSQVFGIIFTLGAGWILNSANDIASNLSLAGMLLIGVVMTVFVKSELRRQAAQGQSSELTIKEKYTIKENGCNMV